jgi:dTDP-4-amino-4,6-dideoxygalactose transaminase
MVGTIGDMGCFSLNATKNLPGGEGGLLNTDNSEYVERAKMIRTFGEKVGEQKEKIRSYLSYTIGYNYRTQEMPAAFARSQLKRLSQYNAVAQRNAQYLTREVGKIKGLIAPYVPSDRTSVYHKYRIRFDPEVLGIPIPAPHFRDRLLAALEAEGVAVTLWHLTPLPCFPIFEEMSNRDGKKSRQEPADFPVAQRLLDTSFVICDEEHPIYAQSMDLMECYVQALNKVFDRPEELL